MASRSFDGNGLGSKHVVFLAMMSAGLAVVVFLLGVMVGRGASIVDIVTGREPGSAGVEESFLVEEQPFVASITRREPSMAATDGTDLSYFQRLDDDGGPELDAGLLEPSAPSTATETSAADLLEGGATGAVRRLHSAIRRLRDPDHDVARGHGSRTDGAGTCREGVSCVRGPAGARRAGSGVPGSSRDVLGP